MTIYLILFATGLFAGTVDAIAGGGGLISLPILLSMGMPPHLAFGTNKLQGTVGTLIASRRYYLEGFISVRKIYIGIISGFFGSILGAFVAQVLGNELLRKIIPLFLFIVLIYTILSPKLGSKDEAPRMREFWFFSIFGFGLGFYDGFFGPGTGSLWVFLLAFFLGYKLITATAYTKVFNLNSSLIATLCFAIGGNIDYGIASVMALGQIIGAQLGAHFAIKKGAALIRPLYLTVVTATIVTLGFKSYATSDLFIQITEQFGLGPQILVGFAIFISLIILYVRITRRAKDKV